MRSTLGLVGSGAVATAFAVALARAGTPLVLWSRTPARARRLRGRAARGSPAGHVRLAGELAELGALRRVLLCVADRAIAPVAAELAAAPATARRGRPVALHTSGFHDRAPLDALARAGYATGGVHPLVALPPAETRGAVPPLAGAWFATSGVPDARRAARAIVRAVGGRELALARGADARRRYHAAASLLAGGSVALFDAASELLEGIAPPARAREALASLLAGVAANVGRRGAREALTGPAARGDVEVVAGHLALLDEDAAALYRAVLVRMLALASERGSLPAARRRELERLL